MRTSNLRWGKFDPKAKLKPNSKSSEIKRKSERKKKKRKKLIKSIVTTQMRKTMLLI
jgi:hypothetical protein